MNYEDLAPYYDKVEMLIGVYGGDDDLENTPRVLGRRVAAAAEAARQRPAGEAARGEGRRAGDPHAPRGDDHAARSRTPAETAAPGNAKAQAILAADMQKRSRLLLGHALRPRLLDPG